MRKKVVNLFSKNHIIFTKTSGIPPISTKLNIVEKYFGEDYRGHSSEIVRKISKLGFYYDSIEYHHYNRSDKSIRIKELRFSYDDEVYELSYIEKYGESKINIDLRPWNIHPGDKSMPDHFVTDLLNLITKYFIEVPDLAKFRSEVFEDLFGYPDGPKYQTDEEKILSHGFDIKESFRKSKEL